MTRVNNTPKPHPYLPTPLPNTLGKYNAIPAKIRCLNKKHASGVDVAEVASYTAQTRNEVTEERYVTMVNGRIETPHAWSVKELERDELELTEKRKFLQQRRFGCIKYQNCKNIIQTTRPYTPPVDRRFSLSEGTAEFRITLTRRGNRLSTGGV